MQAGVERLGGQVPSDAEMKAIVQTWRVSLEELDALDPPAAREIEFRKMIAAFRRTLDALELMTTTKDESVLAAAAGVSLFGHRAARAARRASLERCVLFPEVTQPEPDPEPIRDATLALVPESVEIARPADQDCGAKSSCVVEFRGSGALERRVRAAQELLRAAGWTNIRKGKTAGTGNAWVMANRNDYLATIELVGNPLPAHCATARVTWSCVDSVWVHRVEVPEAFLTDDADK